MSYSEPVPGGTIGRTDQGVDISGAPGTPVRAITNETLVGIIQNWYAGQPFYWFKQAGSNVYNYVAEQFSSNLKVGQSVQAGQQIGQIAPSGTGLELGFATAGGQTQAMATTGYTEGEQTQSGQAYRAQVINGGSAPGSAAAAASAGRTPGTTDLAQLWIDAGGSPALANTMAAIAEAESSGQVGSVGGPNSNGTYDYGLWQINSSHTQFNKQQLTTDPLYNAKAAVSIFKSQGLGAWSTYNNQKYLQFISGAANAQYTGANPTYGGTRPGGGPPGSSPSSSGGATGVQTELQNYVSLRDMSRTAPPGTKNPFQWWKASFTGNWNNLGGGVS